VHEAEGIAAGPAGQVPHFAEDHGMAVGVGGDSLVAVDRPVVAAGPQALESIGLVAAFIGAEGRRLAIPRWLPVLATVTVGVSLGFPLFLYMRQLKLDAPVRAVQGPTR